MTTHWNDIAIQHSTWVASMGWHNKTVLESIALIGSEIGEAAAECLEDRCTDAFGMELADIVLRTADLSRTEGVNLDEVVKNAGVVGDGEAMSSQRVTDLMLQLLIEWSKFANTARKSSLGPDFGHCMGRLIRRVMDVAAVAGVDLHAEVVRKMAINKLNGTRGRLK
jgi:hypothetical protein